MVGEHVEERLLAVSPSQLGDMQAPGSLLMLL